MFPRGFRGAFPASLSLRSHSKRLRESNVSTIVVIVDQLDVTVSFIA